MLGEHSLTHTVHSRLLARLTWLRPVMHHMDEIIWRQVDSAYQRDVPQRDVEHDLQRHRLALCEAVLGQIATGVAVLEPSGADRSLDLVMINEVAAVYFGWLGLGDGDVACEAMVAHSTDGLRTAGIFALAELVSLTGRMHTQEAVAVPGAMAAGQRVDLCITPAGDSGAVVVTFVDVTHSVRPPVSG